MLIGVTASCIQRARVGDTVVHVFRRPLIIIIIILYLYRSQDTAQESGYSLGPVHFFSSFSELCWGKAMVSYTMPQKWKKEESERLRGREIRSSLSILDLKDGKL